MIKQEKVFSLGLLRGIAVVAVCFCHLGNPLSTKSGDLFSLMHQYGKYGVQIFFVISGFVIPYSMLKADYKITNYFNFLVKRVLRLHPPYLVALIITLLLVAASNKVRHIAFPETLSSIFLSLFYLHTPSANPVFWSLKIEAEYYILIGLYFSLLKWIPEICLCITVPLFMLLSQSQAVHYFDLFYSLPFFLIGLQGYLIFTKSRVSVFAYIALFGLLIFCFKYYDIAAGIAALFTISFILIYRSPVNKIFDQLGNLSYSIYLIHFPIGIKILNLLIRYVNPTYYWLLFFVTNIIVLLVSIGFWRYIEEPATKISNKIKYGKPMFKRTELT